MLEQLFHPTWLARKSWFAFFLGFSYAALGIASALLLFPGEPAFPAVAFASLLAVPSLNKMLTAETKQAASELKFDLTDPFKNHHDIFEVYVFLFLGVLLAFAAFALLLPGIAGNGLFAEQIAEVGLSGRATGGPSFSAIFYNNMMVFVFALVASFVYGSGAVFIIIWNASVWGVVFGIAAWQASAVTLYSPFVHFAKTMLAVAPHMVTEASAYVIAAIAGGVLSKVVIRERLFSHRFWNVVKGAGVIFFVAVAFLVLSAYVEIGVTPKVFKLLNLN